MIGRKETFVVIGGGLAGLYAARCLRSRYSDSNILVMEKSKRFGGRILSTNLGFRTVEMGAGVIPGVHDRMLKLVQTLGLSKQLSGGSETKRYYQESSATIDRLSFYQRMSELNTMVDSGTIPKQLARCYTLFYLLARVYGVKIASEMKHQLGYDGDFECSNALDALRSFSNKNPYAPNTGYYSMKGGLEQIIQRLTQWLRQNHVHLWNQTAVLDVQAVTSNTGSGGMNPRKYAIVFQRRRLGEDGGGQERWLVLADRVVVAIPKLALLELPAFLSVKRLLNTVACKPFMRLYIQFPTANGTSWFDFMPNVVTTGTLLRQIIPIDKSHGLMELYVDDNVARIWRNLRNNGFLRSEVMLHLRRTFPTANIPEPQRILTHYCNEATHVWRPGRNGAQLSRRLLRPWRNENIFLVGETYAEKQEWMQSAVESVDRLMTIL